MIQLICPGCRRGIQASEKVAGRTLDCPGCGVAVMVPSGVAQVPQVLAVADAGGVPAEDPKATIERELGKDLPPEVFDLGQILFPCRPQSTKQAFAVAAGVILALVGLGIVANVGSASRLRPDTAPAGFAKLFLFALGGILMVGGVCGAVAGICFLGEKTVVFARGFVTVRFRKPTVWRWEDIEMVWLGKSHITVYVAGFKQSDRYHEWYSVRHKNGQKFMFTQGLCDVEPVGAILGQLVRDRIYPAALQTYRSGGTVDFDFFTVSREGIAKAGDSLRWPEVINIVVDKGIIRIRSRKRTGFWAEPMVYQVANVQAFLKMTEIILQEHGNQPAEEGGNPWAF